MKSSSSAAPADGTPRTAPLAVDWDAITANADPDPVELDRAAEDAKWAGAQAFTGDTTPAQARAVQGARRVGQRGPQVAPVKKQISFRIRPAVLEAWRATGPGWMNSSPPRRS